MCKRKETSGKHALLAGIYILPRAWCFSHPLLKNLPLFFSFLFYLLVISIHFSPFLFFVMIFPTPLVASFRENIYPWYSETFIFLKWLKIYTHSIGVSSPSDPLRQIWSFSRKVSQNRDTSMISSLIHMTICSKIYIKYSL